MATYRYRAATAGGQLKSGVLDRDLARRRDRAHQASRASCPSRTVETSTKAKGDEKKLRLNTATRRGIVNAIPASTSRVLLNAGLPLDRALAVVVENLTRPTVKTVFAKLRDRVRQGATLARAMTESNGAFSPMASAMAEAGEASGKLDEPRAVSARTMERGEPAPDHRVVDGAYPVMLMVIASSVILIMLLFVVPQFEDLFADTGAKLPAMTQIIMGASHMVATTGSYAAGFIAIAAPRSSYSIAGCSSLRSGASSTARCCACRSSAPSCEMPETARFAHCPGLAHRRRRAARGRASPRAALRSQTAYGTTRSRRSRRDCARAARLSTPPRPDGVVPFADGDLRSCAPARNGAARPDAVAPGRCARPRRAHGDRASHHDHDSCDHRDDGGARRHHHRFDYVCYPGLQRFGGRTMTIMQKLSLRSVRTKARGEGGFTFSSFWSCWRSWASWRRSSRRRLSSISGPRASQTAKVQIQNVMSALELYRLDAGRYPTQQDPRSRRSRHGAPDRRADGPCTSRRTSVAEGPVGHAVRLSGSGAAR